MGFCALNFVLVAESDPDSMKEIDHQLSFHLKNCNQAVQTFAFELTKLLSTCAFPRPFALEGFRDSFLIIDKLMTVD